MPELLTSARSRGTLTLADLLAPLTPREFLGEYWGKRHLVVRRQPPLPETEILSSEDVDRYLAIASRHPSAHLAVIDASRRERRMRVMDVPPHELYGAFSGGATLRLDHIERYWSPAAELAAALATALEARVKINAYFTPGGLQGAPIHPDLQDVFALQQEGAKDWYVYDQTIYEPAEGERYLRYLPKRPRPFSDEEPPLAERTRLHPGDVLYLPRGVLHRAVAAKDSASLHLALCVTPTYWVDVVKAAAEVASLDRSELSDRLPPGFAGDPSLHSSLRERFETVLALLSGEGCLERAIQALESDRVATSSFPGDGHFRELLHLEEIAPDTRMERRPGPTYRVERTDHAAVLRFGAVRVSAPAAVAPAFEFVRDHERFRVSELPGPLSEEGRLVLVRRLVREGLLRRAAPEE